MVFLINIIEKRSTRLYLIANSQFLRSTFEWSKVQSKKHKNTLQKKEEKKGKKNEGVWRALKKRPPEKRGQISTTKKGGHSVHFQKHIFGALLLC